MANETNTETANSKQIVADEKELKELITDAVKKGVKKGGRGSFKLNLILLIIVIAFACIFVYQQYSAIHKNMTKADPVGDHDLTLENKGILGYKAADFGRVIIGKSTKEKKLIVDTREVSVPTAITKAGPGGLGIFTKTQNETVFGTGEYTVDLSEIDQDDIRLNESNFTVTVTVPYPELNKVSFEPSKTVIGDTDQGWLAFGSVKMTAEEQKEFETAAVNKLTERLNESDCFEEAGRLAKLSILELLQPVVEEVSPAYKVDIIVAPKAVS